MSLRSIGRQHGSDLASHVRSGQSGVDRGYQVVVVPGHTSARYGRSAGFQNLPALSNFATKAASFIHYRSD